jgi:hypothetical protein
MVELTRHVYRLERTTAQYTGGTHFSKAVCAQGKVEDNDDMNCYFL